MLMFFFWLCNRIRSGFVNSRVLVLNSIFCPWWELRRLGWRVRLRLDGKEPGAAGVFRLRNPALRARMLRSR
jgi:hypothetical protein